MKRGTKIGLVIVMIASVMALGLTACAKEVPAPAPTPTPAPAKLAPIKWIAQSCHNEANPVWPVEVAFAKEIGRVTDGRLVVDLKPTGTLVKIMEMFDATSTGGLDMFYGSNSWWGGKDPGFFFFGSAPFTLETFQANLWGYAYGGREILSELYAGHNLRLLTPVFVTSEPFGSTVPIRSLEDFKGLKIRTAGLAAKLFAKLGATPMTVTGADIYLALERGVVDAYEYGAASSNAAFGLDEVTKYYIMPCIHAPNTDLAWVANMDSWNKLPDDLKELVQIASDKMGQIHLLETYAADVSVLHEQVVVKKSVEVIELPPADVAKARATGEEIAAEYAAKSPLAGKAWKSIQDFRTIYAPQAALIAK